jgi:2-oxo-3-(phosphooxy)propyl 3-oxoalkanoate synthase
MQFRKSCYFLSYMESWDVKRPPAPQPRPLSWSRTVDREMVHRASVAEVLITDVLASGGDSFEAAAHWSRSHPTFPRGHDDRHNPLMIVETLRQLGIFIPLRHYAVPPRTHFLITDVSFALDPLVEPRAGYGATEVTCRVSVDNLRMGTRGGISGMRLRSVFSAGGRSFAQAEGGARFFDGHRYTSLRGPRTSLAPWTPTRSAAARARPVPEHVGVASPQDVLLALQRDSVLLDPVDLRHPFFFDHKTDHVPGMALVEAARQAAAVISGGRLQRPVACRLRAARFTEFTPPALVECTVRDRTCVFRFHQYDTQTAVGVFRYP